MAISGLLAKLHNAGAIAKCDGSFYFTEMFGRYLFLCICNDFANARTIKGWRRWLGDFHPTLALLSQEEIVAVIELIRYQVESK